jgi:hypothetical protein
MTGNRISRFLIGIFFTAIIASIGVSCKTSQNTTGVQVKEWATIYVNPALKMDEGRARQEVEVVKKLVYDYIDSFNVANKTTFRALLKVEYLDDGKGGIQPVINVILMSSAGPGTWPPCPNPIPSVHATYCGGKGGKGG